MLSTSVCATECVNASDVERFKACLTDLDNTQVPKTAVLQMKLIVASFSDPDQFFKAE